MTPALGPDATAVATPVAADGGVEPQQVVLERGGGTLEATLKPANLHDAPFDDERLRRQMYLTMPELRQYLCRSTVNAARCWLHDHPEVRRFGSIRKRLVMRADVDRALAWEQKRK